MIDNFTLGLTHGLMLLAAWRLLSRPDLDDDDTQVEGKGRRRGGWNRIRDRSGA